MNKCPECGALSGHAIECERKTPEEWRAAALQYYAAWLKQETDFRKRIKSVMDHHNVVFNRLYDRLQLFEGKFRVVKHENNQLRKKLKK